MNKNGRRKSLLFLSPIMPAAHGNGLAMRAGFFLDAYASQFKIDLVVVPVAGHIVPSKFVYTRVNRIQVINAERPETYYHLITSLREPSARITAFANYGRSSLSARVTPLCRDLEMFVGDTRYDLVHVFRLYLGELVTPLIRKMTQRKVLDCDEDDALAYRRIAKMERKSHNLFAAQWAEQEAVAFERLKEVWLPRFDVVLASSRSEERSLARFCSRTCVVPNVVTRGGHSIKKAKGLPTLLFVGTLGYRPNADAVEWFFGQVWRRLQQTLRHRVRLVIVGPGLSPAIARIRSQRGVLMTGRVDDVSRYYGDADLVIVPLRAGGGTRIKLIEAAAYGLPAIASSFGALGTTFRRDRDVLIADSAANVLRACVRLIRDAGLRRRLGANARTKARQRYSASYWRSRVLELIMSQGCGDAVDVP
jgi:glycosyltransferase involved in cell wall biosynthesis